MFKVSRLSFSRSGKKILADITVTLGKGERLGILGENGAGKSSLLACFSTLMRPDGGSVVFDGADVFAAPRSYRRICGYAPEVARLYPSLTAREHLQFCADLFGVAKEVSVARIDHLVDEFGLVDFFDRPCGFLSKGQAQRVSLATAVVHAPRIVCFDEPFSGLDKESQERFLAYLNTQLTETIVVMTAHEREGVLACCHRTATLKEGRLQNFTKVSQPESGDFQKVVGI